MYFRHCTRVASKQIIEKKLFNNVRTFYNDTNFIDEMSINLRNRRVNIERKKETEKGMPDIRSETDTSFKWYSTEAPSEQEFSLFHIKDWWEYRKKLYAKKDQTFIAERHMILGSDLAAAHFIVSRGGKVMFKGDHHWVERRGDGTLDMPSSYHPAFLLEKLDLNGFLLMYEGLDNLCNLLYLKWLSLRGCEVIDDWALDKLACEYPSLEYLDVSDCKNLTERGLEALYKMPNLKKLIVTNHYKSPAFELTCMMLEDVNPYLTCEIKTPGNEPVLEE